MRSFQANPTDKKSLSNEFIFKIHKTKKEELWIGTNDGLNLLNRKDTSFLPFFEKDGLKSAMIIPLDKKMNWSPQRLLGGLPERDVEGRDDLTKCPVVCAMIRGITETVDGELVIGMQNGVSILDPKANRFRNYSVINGIDLIDVTMQRLTTSSNSTISVFNGFSHNDATHIGQQG